jgi:hypothetical protein
MLRIFDRTRFKRSPRTNGMSYDIGLYEKNFLKRATAEDLGDFTVAPQFSAAQIAAIKERVVALGYSVESDGAGCTEFIHPKASWGLQVSVFKTEVAFSVPYWKDAQAAIAQAKSDARRLAQEFDLGLSDPQDGEMIC